MDITEQEYIQLDKDCKLKYDELQKIIQKKDDELQQIKKELISCYGYVRILDNLYNQQVDIEPNIEMMLNVLRDFLSQFAEDNLGI